MRYLRRIDPTLWIREADWLREEDVPADAVRDLRSTNNTLSVWQVETNTPEVIERIAAAMTLTRESIVHFVYKLIDPEEVGRAEITAQPVNGGTPDDSINSWHCNLEKLTAQNVADLARIIQNGERGMILDSQVLEILAAHNQQWNDSRIKLSKKERMKVDALRATPPLITD